MMSRVFRHNGGFSLIELIVIIVVLGILAAVAMQSMSASVEDIRRIETEREMDMLADAMVGNASLYSGGARSDFGYVGDIGAFPLNLQALAENPGGYTTWNGPYLPAGFVQDTVGYLLDAWGQPYQYAGGVIVTSGGGGTPITKKIANAAADYLSNTLSGVITDANDSVPGIIYMDSVDIAISIPDGSGGTTTRQNSHTRFSRQFHVGSSSGGNASGGGGIPSGNGYAGSICHDFAASPERSTVEIPIRGCVFLRRVAVFNTRYPASIRSRIADRIDHR